MLVNFLPFIGEQRTSKKSSRIFSKDPEDHSE